MDDLLTVLELSEKYKKGTTKRLSSFSGERGERKYQTNNADNSNQPKKYCFCFSTTRKTSRPSRPSRPPPPLVFFFFFFKEEQSQYDTSACHNRFSDFFLVRCCVFAGGKEGEGGNLVEPIKYYVHPLIFGEKQGNPQKLTSQPFLVLLKKLVPIPPFFHQMDDTCTMCKVNGSKWKLSAIS